MSDAAQHDDQNTAYPANEATPGQAQSRQARKRFLQEHADACPWWQEYLELRLEGWDWRKAAYIAWAASPSAGRWPATQQELATAILGMRSDRSVRNWKRKYPEMDERVATLQIAPLMQHRRDAINALVESTKIVGNKGAPDRRTYFQLTGDLKAKSGEGRQPAGVAAPVTSADSGRFSGMDEDQLDQAIANMQSALLHERQDSVGFTTKARDDDDGE